MSARTCYTPPVHHLDFLDICAVMLGIWFTISKLDAQGRSAEAFPHVPPAEFERWRAWTVSIFRLGSTVCFLRVVFHQGWAFYLSRHPLDTPAAPKSWVVPALLMDALFLGVVAATFIRGSRARELRRRLGIVLQPLTPKEAAALAPEDESKAATKPD
jgi:hypothetical protein